MLNETKLAVRGKSARLVPRNSRATMEESGLNRGYYSRDELCYEIFREYESLGLPRQAILARLKLYNHAADSNIFIKEEVFELRVQTLIVHGSLGKIRAALSIESPRNEMERLSAGWTASK